MMGSAESEVAVANVMVAMDAMQTVTEVMESTERARESGADVSVSLGAWASAHCVDVAVASEAKVMRLALPTAKKSGVAEQYNRWLMLADELSVDGDDGGDDADAQEEEEPVVDDADVKGADDAKVTGGVVTQEPADRDADVDVANGDHETNETE